MRRELNSLSYTPHPPQNRFKGFKPPSFVGASQNEIELKFSELLELRRVVESISFEIGSYVPDLMPFFATGGIPLVLPALEILAKRSRDKATDSSHFHMFPGLSWKGKLDGMNSEDYFKNEFIRLIQDQILNKKQLRIWSVDATFTGNAINKLIKVIHQVFLHLDPKPIEPEVSILAIIDSSRAKKVEEGNTVPLTSQYGTLYLQNSAEYSASKDLVENRYIPFSRNDGDDLFKLNIKYHVVSTILTEDRAELIGATAAKTYLGITEENVIGHAKIIFENGLNPSGTGGSSIGRNILSWLASPETLEPWFTWKRIADSAPVSDDEKANYDKYNQLLKDGLTYFDIVLQSENLSKEELDKLLELPRLLNCIEVKSLYDTAIRVIGKTHSVPKNISNKLLIKVQVSTLENSSCQKEAIELFRLCYPKYAKSEPKNLSDSDLHCWWGKKLRPSKS